MLFWPPACLAAVGDQWLTVPRPSRDPHSAQQHCSVQLSAKPSHPRPYSTLRENKANWPLHHKQWGNPCSALCCALGQVVRVLQKCLMKKNFQSWEITVRGSVFHSPSKLSSFRVPRNLAFQGISEGQRHLHILFQNPGQQKSDKGADRGWTRLTGQVGQDQCDSQASTTQHIEKASKKRKQQWMFKTMNALIGCPFSPHPSIKENHG